MGGATRRNQGARNVCQLRTTHLSLSYQRKTFLSNAVFIFLFEHAENKLGDAPIQFVNTLNGYWRKETKRTQ